MGGAFASEKQVCVCVFLNDCGSEHMNSVSDVYVRVLLTNETYSMHWHPLQNSVYTYSCALLHSICKAVYSAFLVWTDGWMNR